MANIWHDINPDRIQAEDFIAVIEISKGSKKKYELDKETGYIVLDRIRQRIILLIMVLFRGLMEMTRILWM